MYPLSLFGLLRPLKVISRSHVLNGGIIIFFACLPPSRMELISLMDIPGPFPIPPTTSHTLIPYVAYSAHFFSWAVQIKVCPEIHSTLLGLQKKKIRSEFFPSFYLWKNQQTYDDCYKQQQRQQKHHSEQWAVKALHFLCTNTSSSCSKAEKRLPCELGRVWLVWLPSKEPTKARGIFNTFNTSNSLHFSVAVERLFQVFTYK